MDQQPFFRGDIVIVKPGTPYAGYVGRVDDIAPYSQPGFDGCYVNLTKVRNKFGGFEPDTSNRLYMLPAAECELVQPGPFRPIELTEMYWDCECETNYIHPAHEKQCPVCGALKEDQPPARVNEVNQHGLATT